MTTSTSWIRSQLARTLTISVLVLGGCMTLPFPLLGTRTTTETVKTEETITVNNVESRPAKRKARRGRVASSNGAKSLRATCHKNSECGSGVCVTGAGNLGYCSKMCDSWSDCPSSWECNRAATGAQRVCMQEPDDF